MPAPLQSPVVHHTSLKRVTTAPPASTGISVEVYQGDKKMDVVKFPDENSETK
jgi:hypothetical protein